MVGAEASWPECLTPPRRYLSFLLVGDAGLQCCDAAVVVGPEGAGYAHGTMVVMRDVLDHPSSADVMEVTGSEKLLQAMLGGKS